MTEAVMNWFLYDNGLRHQRLKVNMSHTYWNDKASNIIVVIHPTLESKTKIAAKNMNDRNYVLSNFQSKRVTS